MLEVPDRPAFPAQVEGNRILCGFFVACGS